MLKTYKDFEQKAIPIMRGLNSGGITNYETGEKVIDFSLWYKPIAEKYDAQMDCIKLKYDKCFTINPYGGFMIGEKGEAKFQDFLKERDEFLSKEIPECEIRFLRPDFKDSRLDVGIKTLMIGAGILS